MSTWSNSYFYGIWSELRVFGLTFWGLSTRLRAFETIANDSMGILIIVIITFSIEEYSVCIS